MLTVGVRDPKASSARTHSWQLSRSVSSERPNSRSLPMRKLRTTPAQPDRPWRPEFSYRQRPAAGYSSPRSRGRICSRCNHAVVYARVLLCYITDRLQFPGNDSERTRRLLAKVAEAARCGVDWVQLRERDLTARELERLAREAVAVVREASSRTRLLINSRIDVALAAGADGVHLRSDDIAASEARVIWTKAGRRTNGGGVFGPPVIGVSCHATNEVRLAEAHGADFALFAPVFEKHGSAG